MSASGCHFRTTSFASSCGAVLVQIVGACTYELSEQARTAGHELAADIGFEPNQAANEVGSDEGPLRFVAVGGGGRSLIVAQQAGDHSIIEVYYRTGCSGHASMQEAYDRIMGERREERREERRQDREERLEELREG